MESIRMNTLKESTQLGFFYKNLELNFLFHPRHWKFALTFRKQETKSYCYRTFRFRFLFIQFFFPLMLVRKLEPQVHTSL
ncbi:hypothetical protein SAMN05444274_1257 [Mariniphaga anaerophila]|uniref:Uncharacterized protein n=1 Tax=Mariniphaga anaerophila TaxID=1484053 RepID=A0A1M5GKY0_9BACT|nr:hypothetical protein SAMN05444274_1257 [Mariniphaga anaerophila]